MSTQIKNGDLPQKRYFFAIANEVVQLSERLSLSTWVRFQRLVFKFCSNKNTTDFVLIPHEMNEK